MWQLAMAEKGKKWETAGSFDSVTAAARRFLELEGGYEYCGHPLSGVFFQIRIETDQILIETERGNDEEALTYLEHTGKNTNACYVVKRIKH